MQNERNLKELVISKIGNVFEGKIKMKDLTSKVEISTDESIITKDYNLLIEVDSGNYAKLIIGQYVLINTLIHHHKINENGKKPVFIVVHYHNRNTSNPYNSFRTKKNLNHISKSIYKSKGVKFLAFNLKEFTDFIENIRTKKDLNNLIKKELQK